MKKVHLILQRHILKQTKRSTVWSEWYLFSINDCFLSFDDAIARVNELRQIADSKNLDSVEYRAQVLFLR